MISPLSNPRKKKKRNKLKKKRAHVRVYDTVIEYEDFIVRKRKPLKKKLKSKAKPDVKKKKRKLKPVAKKKAKLKAKPVVKKKRPLKLKIKPSVKQKRDSKGRFVSAKRRKRITVVKKAKFKAVKKPKAKQKPKCNFRPTFEKIVPGITGHYNVVGVKHLSKECLAILLDNQLKRGALRFRLWYKVESSPQYPNGIASTEPFWYTKFQGKGGILGYLKRLDAPVEQYWIRTKDFKMLKAGQINLHGVLSEEYRK